MDPAIAEQARQALTRAGFAPSSVDDDGTASGRVVGLCEFMPLRAQRTPLAADEVGNEDTEAVDSSTDRKPWLVANDEHVRWATAYYDRGPGPYLVRQHRALLVLTPGNVW